MSVAKLCRLKQILGTNLETSGHPEGTDGTKQSVSLCWDLINDVTPGQRLHHGRPVQSPRGQLQEVLEPRMRPEGPSAGISWESSYHLSSW